MRLSNAIGYINPLNLGFTVLSEPLIGLGEVSTACDPPWLQKWLTGFVDPQTRGVRGLQNQLIGAGF